MLFGCVIGPKPRWVPLDIEPPSVRPKSQKSKSARSPKDVSNNAQDGRKSAAKGFFFLLQLFEILLTGCLFVWLS